MESCKINTPAALLAEVPSSTKSLTLQPACSRITPLSTHCSVTALMDVIWRKDSFLAVKTSLSSFVRNAPEKRKMLKFLQSKQIQYYIRTLIIWPSINQISVLSTGKLPKMISFFDIHWYQTDCTLIWWIIKGGIFSHMSTSTYRKHNLPTY